MDINTWRGISTILVAIAFFAICWWAFSPKRKKRFDEAANLPFADEKREPESEQDQNADGENSTGRNEKQ